MSNQLVRTCCRSEYCNGQRGWDPRAFILSVNSRLLCSTKDCLPWSGMLLGVDGWMFQKRCFAWLCALSCRGACLPICLGCSVHILLGAQLRNCRNRSGTWCQLSLFKSQPAYLSGCVLRLIGSQFNCPNGPRQHDVFDNSSLGLTQWKASKTKRRAFGRPPFLKTLSVKLVLVVLGYSVVDSNSSIWALGSMEVRALRFKPLFLPGSSPDVGEFEEVSLRIYLKMFNLRCLQATIVEVEREALNIKFAIGLHGKA